MCGTGKTCFGYMVREEGSGVREREEYSYKNRLDGWFRVFSIQSVLSTCLKIGQLYKNTNLFSGGVVVSLLSQIW